MIAKLHTKQTITHLIGNCAGKADTGDDGHIKLPCTWSKMLRFTPGLKFKPDEFFEVKFLTVEHFKI